MTVKNNDFVKRIKFKCRKIDNIRNQNRTDTYKYNEIRIKDKQQQRSHSMLIYKKKVSFKT